MTITSVRVAGAGAPATPRSPAPRPRNTKVLFVVPLVLVLVVTGGVPIVYSLFLSLFDWNWGARMNFVGLQNYVELLAHSEFWLAMLRSGWFTVMAVAAELALGLVVALAVNRVRRGAGFLRTFLILPLMVSGIVVALVWKVMLDPTLGVIPRVASIFGVSVLDLLGSAASAMPTIAGIDTWWQTGFVFIILCAGLAGLPQEPFEAANMDGANAWQRFRYITLPQLAPLLLTVAAIRAVDCLKVFALVFGTTNGGPGTSTMTSQMLAYRTAFREFGMSESMTMMITYSLLIVVVVLIAMTLRRVISRA